MHLGNAIMPTKLSATPAFRACVTRVFNKFDTNGNHTIDATELTVAMCHLHFSLVKHSPGLTEPPTSDDVAKIMREHDKDGSSTLDEQEFFDMAVKWFDHSGAMFCQRLILTSLMSMVIIPETANLLHKKIPLARRLPNILFKVLFGVALKVAATNIQSSSKDDE
ncbi:Caltractin [Gracilariopsis chorda]|uniref:Caltractin n=1 Tax=Gracilariopsis chorda TaxID=448386 RepID=A0A2V3IP74_9FLOR|nr:Caltractin [Gracilariopsis chorda]|eukprot:PXF43878.1 Caltractin [Gracilariopsis chorda]